MKEEEIRPQHIFDEYLRLVERDTQAYFGSEPQDAVPCPACGGVGVVAFVKHGFTYEECPECQTLYVSPRPSAATFTRYYRDAESVKYWASTFYKATAEARREKLWLPKARLIQDIVRQFGSPQHVVIDIGGGYGIFAEEYERISGQRVLVIEPGPDLAAVCRAKGLDVVEEFLEVIDPIRLGAGPKAFVSFELFEHLHDPEKFLRHLFGMMVAGDLFMFTTLSGVGVDIQALWVDSKSVSPPQHLNFLNPKSARRLLEHVGFDVVHTSTPGQLDIDILCNNRHQIKDHFWRTFAAQATDDQRKAMQSFVSAQGLSSHMFAVCQKPCGLRS